MIIDLKHAIPVRLEMTEGDITRLNRMYKCPDFVEEGAEGETPADDEMSQTTTEGSIVNGDAANDYIADESQVFNLDDEDPPTYDDEADDDAAMNDSLVEEEIEPPADVEKEKNAPPGTEKLWQDTDSSSLVKLLKSLTAQMLEVMMPICDFRTKMSTILELVNTL